MSDQLPLSGQEIRLKGMILLPYVEQMVQYKDSPASPSSAVVKVTGEEGDAGEQITPRDVAAAKIRRYDLDAIAAAFASVMVIMPGKTTIPELPDELAGGGINIVYNQNVGNGTSNYPTSQQGFSGGGYLQPKNTVNASAAIHPYMLYQRVRHRDKLVNSVDLLFYLTSNATLAQILTVASAALGQTVSDMPVFAPQEIQIGLVGGQISIQQTATTSAGGNFNGTTLSYEYGDSSSKEVGVSTQVEIIPETLHPSLTISVSGSTTASASTTVTASTIAITRNGATLIPAITNTPTSISGSVSGGFSAVGLGATTPTGIPKSGFTLARIYSEQDEFGFSLIRATVVDMSQYA